MIDQLVARMRRGVKRGSPLPADHFISFAGDYASWEDARRDAIGYDAGVILDRTRAALLQVKRGTAVYERDAVIFDRPQYPFPVITGLLRASLTAGTRLRVLDFGGSLGSTYFQCRPLLRSVAEVEWSVVEQPAHVACGREHFADAELRFYSTVDECFSERRPDTLLLSSVLQYLPDPYQTLAALLARGWHHLILDRTSFLAADRDRLTVQRVPEWIYPASYPAWFLSESKLTALIDAAGYTLLTDFAAIDQCGPADERGYYKGFIYERRKR